jgi:hypothetical protein
MPHMDSGAAQHQFLHPRWINSHVRSADCPTQVQHQRGQRAHSRPADSNEVRARAFVVQTAAGRRHGTLEWNDAEHRRSMAKARQSQKSSLATNPRRGWGHPPRGKERPARALDCANHHCGALTHRRPVDGKRGLLPQRQRLALDDAKPAAGIGRLVVERHRKRAMLERK